MLDLVKKGVVFGVAALVAGIGVIIYQQAKGFAASPAPVSWKILPPKLAITCEPWREDIDHGFIIRVEGDPHAALDSSLLGARIDAIATDYPVKKLMTVGAKREKAFRVGRVTTIFAYRKQPIALEAVTLDLNEAKGVHRPLRLDAPGVEIAGCTVDHVGGQAVMFYY